jgi:hypothetical protein
MRIRHHFKRLTATLALAAAGTSGFVALSQTPATAAVTCVNDCINPVTVTTTNNSAKFVFTTTVPTKVRTQIFSGTTKIAEVVPATTFKTSHSITTPALLTANTSYTWKLRAVDEANVLRVETGTLTTKPAGCSVDCVNAVTVTTTSNSATFQFTTTVPTKVRAQVLVGSTVLTEVAPATTFKTSHSIVTSTVLAQNTSYGWRLRVTDESNNLRIETGTLTTKALGCATNCVTGVSPERKPAQVSIKFYTSVPAKATMTVTQNGVFKALAAQSTYSTTQTLKTANVLQPGTTYVLSTQFTDQNGKVYTHVMQYQTAVRRVTVYLDDVYMLDDSDPSGSGEFYAAARLNGAERLLTYNVDLATGWTYSPRVTMTSVNAPETSTFQVRMADTDCVSLCELGLPNTWDSKETDEYSWATATLSIVDPGNWLPTGQVAFNAEVHADVAFSIDGWYQIDYV